MNRALRPLASDPKAANMAETYEPPLQLRSSRTAYRPSNRLIDQCRCFRANALTARLLARALAEHYVSAERSSSLGQILSARLIFCRSRSDWDDHEVHFTSTRRDSGVLWRGT